MVAHVMKTLVFALSLGFGEARTAEAATCKQKKEKDLCESVYVDTESTQRMCGWDKEEGCVTKNAADLKRRYDAAFKDGCGRTLNNVPKIRMKIYLDQDHFKNGNRTEHAESIIKQMNENISKDTGSGNEPIAEIEVAEYVDITGLKCAIATDDPETTKNKLDSNLTQLSNLLNKDEVKIDSRKYFHLILTPCFMPVSNVPRRTGQAGILGDKNKEGEVGTYDLLCSDLHYGETTVPDVGDTVTAASVMVAMHEMAHMLGAKHTEDDNIDSYMEAHSETSPDGDDSNVKKLDAKNRCIVRHALEKTLNQSDAKECLVTTTTYEPSIPVSGTEPSNPVSSTGPSNPESGTEPSNPGSADATTTTTLLTTAATKPQATTITTITTTTRSIPIFRSSCKMQKNKSEESISKVMCTK